MNTVGVGPDVVVLAEVEPTTPNARRRTPTLVHPSLDLYAGNTRFLVRTALIRDEEFEPGDAGPTIRDAQDVYGLCKHLAYADQEHLVTVCLNNQGRVMAIHEAAIGASSGVGQTAMHLIKIAVLTGATRIVVVHNHPGGKSQPSREDVIMARRFAFAADCSGIDLMDSVVIAQDGYKSIRDSGDWPEAGSILRAAERELERRL